VRPPCWGSGNAMIPETNIALAEAIVYLATREGRGRGGDGEREGMRGDGWGWGRKGDGLCMDQLRGGGLEGEGRNGWGSIDARC